MYTLSSLAKATREQAHALSMVERTQLEIFEYLVMAMFWGKLGYERRASRAIGVAVGCLHGAEWVTCRGSGREFDELVRLRPLVFRVEQRVQSDEAL